MHCLAVLGPSLGVLLLGLSWPFCRLERWNGFVAWIVLAILLVGMSECWSECDSDRMCHNFVILAGAVAGAIVRSIAGCDARAVSGCSPRAVSGCIAWNVAGCVAWIIARILRIGLQFCDLVAIL